MAVKRKKPWGPTMVTHGFHPSIGIGLWVTFPKVKIKEAKAKHICVPHKLLYHMGGQICQGKYDLSIYDLSVLWFPIGREMNSWGRVDRGRPQKGKFVSEL